MMKLCMCVMVVIALAGYAFAAQTAGVARQDRTSLPITIKANELIADNKGKTAVFSGKVVAKQGDITIYADRIVIDYGDKVKGDVEKIVATGNVSIVQANRTGRANQAVYESREGRVILTGNPKVTQGADTISGKTITYHIDQDRSEVTGGDDTPVRAIIFPPGRKNSVGKQP